MSGNGDDPGGAASQTATPAPGQTAGGLGGLVRHLLRILLLGIVLGVVLFVAYIGLAIIE